MRELLIILALLFGFKSANSQDMEEVKYLALGDSYTIGEAMSESERWPVQLVTRLRNEGVEIGDPTIIATTGWTTDELQSAIKRMRLPGSYDLVSLLIGVNNQYRGYPIKTYKKEFEELLDQAMALADGQSDRLFVLSIPDYGVTPFTKEKGLNAAKIKRELDEYNEIAMKICARKGVKYFDITEWSRKASNNRALIAADGLHPSGKMYKNWVDTCYPWVKDALMKK